LVVQRAIRKEDLFARVGGEEFVLLARATRRPDAILVADRLRAGVEAHSFVWQGNPIQVTVSLGITTSLEPNIGSPEALVARADELLYRAKENGRNRVEAGDY
jgi:diguanylate cyclase (GGDEF)-like protein